MTTISDQAIKGFKGNRKLIAALAYKFDKTTSTIYNWIKNRDAMLTTPDAVKVISEETGLTQEQILEESEQTVA